MFAKIAQKMPRLTARNRVLLILVFLQICDYYSAHFSALWKVIAVAALGLGGLLRMVARREIVWDRFTILIACTCGFLSLASILNRKFSELSVNNLAICWVYMLFAAATPKDAQPRALQRETRSLAALYACQLLPLMLLAVVSVFIGRPIRLPFRKLGIKTPGLFSDRIRIYSGGPQRTAKEAAACFFFLVYLLYQRLSKPARALTIAGLVVCLFTMTHAQSRTVIWSFSIGIGAMVFRWIYLRLPGKRRRALAGLAGGACATALVILLLLALFSLDVKIAMRLHDPAPRAASSAIAEQLPEASEESDAADAVPMSRFITLGPINLTENGRGLIWATTIRYLRDHPLQLIFGMGTGDVVYKIANAYNVRFASMAHLHNSLLELLARGGIFGLLCMLAALCLLFRPTLRLLMAPEVEGDRGAYMLAIQIGTALLIAQAGVTLFSYDGCLNLFFFHAAGHVMRLNREGKLARGVDAPPRE